MRTRFMLEGRGVLAGQEVEVVCEGGLVQLHHRGVLIATHARRHAPDKQTAGLERGRRLPPARKTSTAASVTRKVDTSGNVCFAGTNYRVGFKYRRRQVQVTVVGDTVEISIGNELIRSHAVKHDRTANTAPSPTPVGDPTGPTPRERSECQAATGVDLSCGYRGLTYPA